MRIGLISRGRTCSTAVLLSLINKYNLTNHHEIYFKVGRNLYHDYYSISKGDHNRNSRFKDNIIKFTNNLFLEDNFITKLWPSMFIATPHRVLEPFIDTKEKIIFDTNTYLRIKEYDQLYFLDRDLHTSASSWVYSKKSKIWRKQPKQPIITIDPNDYGIVKFYILEYCLQQKMKTFMLENNIPFIDIGTNAEPYIDPTAKIVKSNNAYSSLITNYDELHNFITDYYKICMDNTKDWYYT